MLLLPLRDVECIKCGDVCFGRDPKPVGHDAEGVPWSSSLRSSHSALQTFSMTTQMAALQGCTNGFTPPAQRSQAHKRLAECCGSHDPFQNKALVIPTVPASRFEVPRRLFGELTVTEANSVKAQQPRIRARRKVPNNKLLSQPVKKMASVAASILAADYRMTEADLQSWRKPPVPRLSKEGRKRSRVEHAVKTTACQTDLEPALQPLAFGAPEASAPAEAPLRLEAAPANEHPPAAGSCSGSPKPESPTNAPEAEANAKEAAPEDQAEGASEAGIPEPAGVPLGDSLGPETSAFDPSGAQPSQELLPFGSLPEPLEAPSAATGSSEQPLEAVAASAQDTAAPGPAELAPEMNTAVAGARGGPLRAGIVLPRTPSKTPSAKPLSAEASQLQLAASPGGAEAKVYTMVAGARGGPLRAGIAMPRTPSRFAPIAVGRQARGQQLVSVLGRPPKPRRLSTGALKIYSQALDQEIFQSEMILGRMTASAPSSPRAVPKGGYAPSPVKPGQSPRVREGYLAAAAAKVSHAYLQEVCTIGHSISTAP